MLLLGSLVRCLYGCDTWALCAASLFFGYNDLYVHPCGWNVFYFTFWTAKDLGFFFAKVAFLRAYLNVFYYNILLGV